MYNNQILYEVHNELLNNLRKTPDRNIKPTEFRTISDGLFFNFMEECRNNIFIYNDGKRSNKLISDLRIKYQHTRKVNFYPKSNGKGRVVAYIHIPTQELIEEPAKDNFHELLLIQLEYLDHVIEYLHITSKQLIIQSEEHNNKGNTKKDKRQGTLYKTFYSRVHNDILFEVYEMFVKNGWLEKNQEKNFINNFKGGSIPMPLRWLGCINTLSYFIKRINGNAVRKEYRKWQITTQCFINKDGSPLKIPQLRHTKRPPDTRAINWIIEFFIKEFEDTLL